MGPAPPPPPPPRCTSRPILSTSPTRPGALARCQTFRPGKHAVS